MKAPNKRRGGARVGAGRPPKHNAAMSPYRIKLPAPWLPLLKGKSDELRQAIARFLNLKLP